MIEYLTKVNWVPLILGPFIGAFAAFLSNQGINFSKKYGEKVVSANLALITIKNQYNEFLIFRKSFREDVARYGLKGDEPVWALIRPAHLDFGKYEFDFKSIGFLLEKPGNEELFNLIELVQISHRDLAAINTLRTENAVVIQERISEYQKNHTVTTWNEIAFAAGTNLTSLMHMVAVGMALRADRNEEIYLDAFNKLRDACELNLGEYYLNKMRKFLPGDLGRKNYSLVKLSAPKPSFTKEVLPPLPHLLASEIATIPADE
ncbi:hypothetical protein G6674_06215 [Polynucleobacter paneuropaeus]|nr:hypothetical protein G6674_06215 [Polynucleobacter paneuropaeus]